uniref:Uncharacterized protein n=1 Tax=Mycena chlorophos TaxID=658473 RepID=A0ABQ0LWB8_MYCCL|nr:predicted protein [Mycena chlorophos]
MPDEARKKAPGGPVPSSWTQSSVLSDSDDGARIPAKAATSTRILPQRENRGKNPLRVDVPPEKPRSRRSKAEAQRARDDAEAAKEAARRKREQGLQKAAAAELKSLQAGKGRGASDDHPVPSDLEKIPRLRAPKAHTAKTVDYGLSPEKPLALSDHSSDDDDASDIYEDDKEAASGGGGDGGDDDDEEMEIEGSDAGKEPTPKEKAKKRKTALRQQVDVLRHDMDERASLPPPKRKASDAVSIESTKSRKKKKGTTGLNPNWERGGSAFLGEDGDNRGRPRTANSSAAPSRSQSAGSALSIPRSEYVSTDVGSEGDWRPVESEDEDDSAERHYAATASVVAARKSLAGIVPTDLPELTRSSTTLANLKVRDIKLRHLPHATVRETFDTFYGSQLVSYAATLKPWQRPSAEERIFIFNYEYPDFKLRPENVGELRVVTKLGDDCIYRAWGKLASTALTLVKDMRQALGATQFKAEVRRLLERVPSDDSTEYYVFCFASIEKIDHDDGRIEWKNDKGIFRGELILGTFAALCKQTKSRSGELGPIPVEDRFPHNGLTLTVQAVHRALTYYKTGDKSEDPLPPFSQDSYGVRPGNATATRIYEVTRLLKAKAWAAIIDGARAAARAKKGKRASRESSPPPPATPAPCIGLLGADSDEDNEDGPAQPAEA